MASLYIYICMYVCMYVTYVCMCVCVCVFCFQFCGLGFSEESRPPRSLPVFLLEVLSGVLFYVCIVGLPLSGRECIASFWVLKFGFRG